MDKFLTAKATTSKENKGDEGDYNSSVEEAPPKNKTKKTSLYF